MKKIVTIILTLCLVVSNSMMCFAQSDRELSLEKQAILQQVENAVLNEDGSVSIPIESGKSIYVDLGNGTQIEYSAMIPNTRATTKTVKASKKYSFVTCNMTISYSANCTWGNPTRCVTINSLTGTYSGNTAEMKNFEYAILTKTSSAGGYATGMGKGEIVFGPINNVLSTTQAFYQRLSVDSADNTRLILTEV